MADTQNPVHADNSTILGDGTSAHPLKSAGGLTSQVRASRVPFTPTNPQLTDAQFDVIVPLVPPFPDNNYTAASDLVVDTASMPNWAPLHVYTAGDVIFDSVTGTIQCVTTGGTSLAVAPAFNTASTGTTAEGGISTVVWQCVDGTCFANLIKQKLPGSLHVNMTMTTPAVGVGSLLPSFATVIAVHD